MRDADRGRDSLPAAQIGSGLSEQQQLAHLQVGNNVSYGSSHSLALDMTFWKEPHHKKLPFQC